MTAAEPGPGPTRGTSRRLLIAGALVIVAALVAVSAFLILRSDPSSGGVEATYDGSELTLTLDDGASITIPAGAARPGSRVRVTVGEPDSLPDLPAYATRVLGAWDFDVEGGILAPVTLRLPAPMTDQTWVLRHYEDGEWVPVPFELIGEQVVATVDSLSWWLIVEHICNLTAAGLFDTSCIGLIVDSFDAALDALWEVYEPELCPNPDQTISVKNSSSGGLIHGCTTVQSKGTHLFIDNLRRFFLDVYPTQGSSEVLVGDTGLPSCCRGILVGGGGFSGWSNTVHSRDIEIAGVLSFDAVIAQIAFMALDLVPGLGVVAHPDILAVTIDVMMARDEIIGLEDEFEKGTLSGLRALLNLLEQQSTLIEKIGEELAKRVDDNPRLIARLGGGIAGEALSEVFKILEGVEIVRTLRDIQNAINEANGWPYGLVRFESRAYPDSNLYRPLQLQSQSPSVARPEAGPTPSGARPTPPAPVPDVPVPMEHWIDEELLGATERPSPTVTPSPAVTPQSTPAWSPTPTLSVSAGWAHTCAVEADGSVTCWGDDEKGQASPPDGEFVSVSAGWAHSCGIRTDRSVVCWGRNEEGQSSAPRGAFISVSAGRVHSCGVRLNGLVECWGEDQPFGRLTIPPNLFNSFSSVSATNYHSCGVRRIGTVACWGYGQGGRTTPPLDRFTSVSVGGDHSCGIRTDGSVACWGNIDEGQATPPPGTFVSVSVSKEGHRTCGVRTDGSAICWGAGIHLGIVSPEIRMPVPIQPDGRFSSISAGAQHICGIRPGGEVVCWGSNDRGPAVTPGVPFVSVSPGDRHECGLRADGSVACYGYDVFEQTNVPPGLFTSLSVGHSHNCAIKKADGSLTCWGWNWDGQATAPAGTFVEVGLAWTHSCGLRESGEIECWGEIDRTPLGGPFKAFATSANGDGCGLRQDDSGSVECWGEHVSGENGPPDEAFTSVAVGWGHACGIRADGTVACWGSLNAYGEASPPDGRFTAISLGNDHSCGLREGGEIECWGANYFGQAEAPDGMFTAISTHTNRTCAVRTDGSYVCWGQ